MGAQVMRVTTVTMAMYTDHTMELIADIHIMEDTPLHPTIIADHTTIRLVTPQIIMEEPADTVATVAMVDMVDMVAMVDTEGILGM